MKEKDLDSVLRAVTKLEAHVTEQELELVEQGQNLLSIRRTLIEVRELLTDLFSLPNIEADKIEAPVRVRECISKIDNCLLDIDKRYRFIVGKVKSREQTVGTYTITKKE